MAKHGLVSSEFYFASSLTEAQIHDLGDIDGKPREEGERTLISNLYLCLGHEGQRALHNQHPHLDMGTIRYPRFLDTCVALFQKERNETYEMYQMLSRKQKEGESSDSFYAELSGMAARCNLCTQERKMMRDKFIFNMRNRDAQNELCRETKTPEEALRIAMSYERGDKYAKTYKGVASGSTGMAYPSPGVPCRSKRNQSTIFVDPGDEQCQGDEANTQIVEEVEQKNECKNGDVTIAINRTSPQNINNDAQQEPSLAIFAKRSGNLRGKRHSRGGGGTGWTNPRG